MDTGILMLFNNHLNLPMADYAMYKKELGVYEMAKPLAQRPAVQCHRCANA